LVAAPFVKLFVESNNNDAAHAEAIREAVQRPGMRFLALKRVEEQDIQTIHRMRFLIVVQRTALASFYRLGEHWRQAHVPSSAWL
jgi:transposase